MDTNALLNRVEELVTPVLENLGLELVERDFLSDQGRWVLRLYIDREETPVTIDDCKAASRAMEGVLDVENVIPQRYSLEVSSPGLNRPLRRTKDFEKFAGERVEVESRQPINGQHNFKGVLKGLREASIVIQEGEQEWLVPFEQLKKARIKYSF